MRREPSRTWTRYGAHPVHLLVLLACFGLAGYAAVLTARSDSRWPLMLLWFAGALLLHDLVLFPASALADRLLRAGSDRLPNAGSTESALPSALNYVRVPLLGCALTLFVYFPGIVRQGSDTYHEATGQTQQPFLGRWLLLCAAMFAVSAVVYGIRLILDRRGRRRGANV